MTAAVNSLDLPKAPAERASSSPCPAASIPPSSPRCLKRQGYDVLGVTLQIYDHGEATHRKGACCAGQDIHDARQVASRLGIPHYVLDYESRFREKVIDPFAESYATGETPVPCVACNQHIKFADLFDTARGFGADALATGHYIVSRPDGHGGRALFRAREPERDQSYFLYATTRAQLDLLRFPLGPYAKAEVRELAREFGLPSPTSMTVRTSASSRAGAIRTCSNACSRARARPATSSMWTAACSAGTRASSTTRSASAAASASAVERPPRASRSTSCGSTRRTRRSSSDRAPRCCAHAALLRDVNWIGEGALGDIPHGGLAIAARVRSTRAPAPALLFAEQAAVKVVFSEDESGVSPGQACVFYESTAPDARVLGGGSIRATEPVWRAAPAPRPLRATALGR